MTRSHYLLQLLPHNTFKPLFAGSAPDGSQVCNASCDCPTENCKLMLLANPGLKSTGWNVCEINSISPSIETTTTAPGTSPFLHFVSFQIWIVHVPWKSVKNPLLATITKYGFPVKKSTWLYQVL